MINEDKALRVKKSRCVTILYFHSLKGDLESLEIPVSPIRMNIWNVVVFSGGSEERQLLK